MRKITMSKIEKLSDEQLDKLDESILNGKLIGEEFNNGIKWTKVEDITTGEELWISEEVEREAEKNFFQSMKRASDMMQVDNIIAIFKSVLDRFYMSKYLDNSMKSIRKEMLAAIYSVYAKRLSEANIDIFKYIAPETLYEELSRYIIVMESENAKSEEKEFSEKLINDYKEARGICRKEVDKIIEEKGGIENWISEKGEETKKSANSIAKNKLLEKVLSDEVSKEEKEKYANLLLKLGFNGQEIAVIIQIGKIEVKDIIVLNSISPLKKVVADCVSRLDINSIITSYLVTHDEGILDSVSWREITPVKLKQAIDSESDMKATFVALFMIEMYKKTGKKFSEKEIDMIFENKTHDKVDMLRAYYELATVELYNDDKVIDVFDEMMNERNAKQSEEESSIRMLTTGDMLSLYTVDVVIKKIITYDRKPDDESRKQKTKFLAYYSRVLKLHEEFCKEDVEEILNKFKTELQNGINNKDLEYLLVVIQLNKLRIIPEEITKEIITLENEDMIFDLYALGLDDKILLDLYESNIITENVIELIYEDQLSDNRLEEKIQSNKISKESIVVLLFKGVIDEKAVKGANFEGLDWKKILAKSEGIDLVNKIASLYANEVIGFEEVKILKEQEVISANDAELILNQLDLDSILLRGLTSEEGVGEKGKRTKKGESRKRDGIALQDRNELLESLGFEAVKNSEEETLVVARGSFKGYRVYREKERKYRVIVFENVGEGSSFIMHEAKAGEFIRTEDNEASLIGSRSEWREKARTSGSVIAKLHTNQWGRNIIEAIIDTSSTFKFDNEPDRKAYVRQETKRLQEENKDMIEYISELKKEERVK